MNKIEFLKNLEINDILKFGEFTLASGGKSDFYIDLRIIPYNPVFFSTVTKQLAEKFENELEFDVICGIPMAGMPFATLIAYFLKKPLVFIRKSPKDHGLNKLIEGVDVKGKKVLIIDDLVSTGFTKEFAIDELRKEGALVDTLGVILDRRENESDSKVWEEAKKVKVACLFKLSKEEILAFKKSK